MDDQNKTEHKVPIPPTIEEIFQIRMRLADDLVDILNEFKSGIREADYGEVYIALGRLLNEASKSERGIQTPYKDNNVVFELGVFVGETLLRLKQDPFEAVLFHCKMAFECDTPLMADMLFDPELLPENDNSIQALSDKEERI